MNMHRWLLIVFALAAVPPTVNADGHRAEAAVAYPALTGSYLDGVGISAGFPLCKLTSAVDCESNNWSLVATWNKVSGEIDGTPTNVESFLAGIRITRKGDRPVRYFAHLLVGGARMRDKVVTAATERNGEWGSGGAVALTGGVEVRLNSVFRLRAQAGPVGYRIGNDSHGGIGIAFALSAGYEVD
jgi:hypothetical protein